MSGQKNSKLKLLYVKDILEKYTDENNALNACDIQEMLEDKGIECERKSIYNDISVLCDYGMDIIHAPTSKRGFFLTSRDFEPAEVRLLSDAVQAANFISKKKTEMLLQKIDSLVSQSQAVALKSQVYIDSRPKCSNEQLFYNIDALDKAIKQNKMVKFVYSRRKLDEKYASKIENKDFIVSPYALIWSNDHYYLVANNSKYDNLMHLRIDRIKNVETLDDFARPFSQVSEYKNNFDAADYSSKSFNMFSGKPQGVELKCSKCILEEMLDRFGDKIPLRKADEGWFFIHIDAAVNDGLASWIMQFGNKIEVISPECLRRSVEEKAKEIFDIYVNDSGEK